MLNLTNCTEGAFKLVEMAAQSVGTGGLDTYSPTDRTGGVARLGRQAGERAVQVAAAAGRQVLAIFAAGSPPLPSGASSAPSCSGSGEGSPQDVCPTCGAASKSIGDRKAELLTAEDLPDEDEKAAGKGGTEESDAFGDGSAQVREKLSNISDSVRTILENLGEDPERDGLLKTPMRVAKALWEMTSGYRANIDEIINGAMFEVDKETSKGSSGDMVVMRSIGFVSMCEHHMLPFYGTADIAYLPGERVLGLSKFARATEVFARRLQVQERLTREIADTVASKTGSSAVAVRVKAEHMCMRARGVRDACSDTVTITTRGRFQTDNQLRNEFFQQVKT